LSPGQIAVGLARTRYHPWEKLRKNEKETAEEVARSAAAKKIASRADTAASTAGQDNSSQERNLRDEARRHAQEMAVEENKAIMKRNTTRAEADTAREDRNHHQRLAFKAVNHAM
jgi:hypothetical protein